MIFLSYARGDDELFVRRLYDDLIANGFKMWYDRTNMPNRALTFHQEIRDAIDASDRLIIVVGPEAIQSDYVRAEWQHALNACKIVIPVIRFGKRDLLPNELRKLNCPDMRESSLYADALADLLRVLGDPVVPLAELRGVPSLPAHFQPRHDYMKDLKNTVLADIHRPVVITSARQTTALQGMGGVGKSVLAAAFARSCETRRAFMDGVVWLTMGQQPDIARNMMVVGRGFNDDLKEYINIESGKARITKVLADKNCLLVLDDIWDVKHAEAFVNALGTRCRLLITTRNGGLSTAIGAQEHRLDVLSIEDAMRFLANYSGQPLNEMPPEAHDVAKECGNLPFALALCGAMVSEGTPWNDLLAALREADLTFITMLFPNYPYPDLLRSLKVSVDALSRTNQSWEKQFKKLAVFPPTEAVPEETVIMFWISTNRVNERSARQLLITLERRALIRLEGKAPNRRVSLHILQHDYLRITLGDLTSLHSELLEVYRQKNPEGWHKGPNDGYFFQRLVHHLINAERKEEAYALLLNFEWLQAKLGATSVIDLIADYDHVRSILLDVKESIGDKVLRLVQGSLLLSGHVLAQDKAQLPGQLVGRLRTNEAPDIQALMKQIMKWKGAPWLCPLIANLTPPGGQLKRTLVGHTGVIRAVSVTPDGRRAISASYDNTLKVWDMETGAEIRTFQGHTGGVNAVSVTPDGRLAISASDDRTLKVWDMETGTEIRTLKGHTGGVLAVSVTLDGRRAISASDDSTLKVWDMKTGAEIRTFQGHTRVNAIAVTPDGRLAISASSDSTLIVWDMETGAEIRTLKGHTGGVLAVSVTPDGRRAISASYDSTLKVWDMKTGAEIRTFQGHTRINAVSVTPDGRLAISASSDSALRVWTVKKEAQISTFQGHTGVVWAVSVTPDGRLAISASSDRTLKVWDIETEAEIHTFQGHTSRVNAISVTPDGRRAISASYDNTLKVWDIETGAEIHTFQGHTGRVKAVSVTPDGRLAISASYDNTLKVWDIETGAEIRTLKGHTDAVLAVSVTPDGRRAISASYDNTLNVWDIETGAEIRTLKGHTGAVLAVSVTRDGRLAISASYDSMLKVWDMKTGVEIHTFQGHTRRVNAISVTPDGRLAISASSDSTLIVWDMETGAEIRTLKGHTDDVIAVSITPDGRLAISASYDSMLKVWDMKTGVEIRTFRGHTGGVRAVSVTPDGRLVISTSSDSTLKVWDIESGSLIASFCSDSPLASCAVVSKDGKKFAVGEESGKVHFLRLAGKLILEC